MPEKKKRKHPLDFMHTEKFKKFALELAEAYRIDRNNELAESGRCIVCMSFMPEMGGKLSPQQSKFTELFAKLARECDDE